MAEGETQDEGTGQPADNGAVRPGYIKLDHPITPTSAVMRPKGLHLPTGPMVAILTGHAAGLQVVFFPPDTVMAIAAKMREEALLAPTLPVARGPIIVPGS